jgi:hypothetical protein
MNDGVSDDDCRELATGYLARARNYLRRLERDGKRLKIHLPLLASIPLLIVGVTDLVEGKRPTLAMTEMALGGAWAIFTKRKELSGAAAAKRASLAELIRELESIPASGPLNAWHRQVVFDARMTMARFAEG